jgi:hypothetical protein
MMCDYCEKREGNKPLLDHGACKAALYYDGFEWTLEVTARQEDRYYGNITEDVEVNFCPMCGRDLREVTR